jgi:hypothetical protein
MPLSVAQTASQYVYYAPVVCYCSRFLLYSFELSGSVEINEIKNNSGSIGIYGDE